MNNNGHRPNHHEQRTLACRGIRGAISVEENTKAAIVSRTVELLRAIVEANGVNQEDIASVIFSATPDLDAEYPAIAARRELGWRDVSLMCGQEMVVPGSLRKCIRVLIHWNTTLRNHEIRHIYLREAVILRPDHSDKQKTLEPPFKS